MRMLLGVARPSACESGPGPSRQRGWIPRKQALDRVSDSVCGMAIPSLWDAPAPESSGEDVVHGAGDLHSIESDDDVRALRHGDGPLGPLAQRKAGYAQRSGLFLDAP